MKNDSLRTTTVYTASEIAGWHVSEEWKPGCWRPARPCPWFGLRYLGMRFRIAWKVFVGRYDALNWGESSGTWNNSEVSYKDLLDKDFIRAGKEEIK